MFSFLFFRNPLIPPCLCFIFFSINFRATILLLGIERVNRSVAACTAVAQQKNPTDYVNGKNGYLESFCQRCSLQTPGIGDAAGQSRPPDRKFWTSELDIELHSRRSLPIR